MGNYCREVLCSQSLAQPCLSVFPTLHHILHGLSIFRLKEHLTVIVADIRGGYPLQLLDFHCLFSSTKIFPSGIQILASDWPRLCTPCSVACYPSNTYILHRKTSTLPYTKGQSATMTENNVAVRRAPWATPQELEDARPLFEQYYKDNDLSRTMELMLEHGIKATSVLPVSHASRLD